MKPARILLALVLTTMAFYGCKGEGSDSDNSNKTDDPGVHSSKLLIDTTGTSTAFLSASPVHERKTFKTYDRSIAEYASSKLNRPVPGKNVIYLLPLGDMPASMDSLIAQEVDYLQRFFQLEVRVMERVPFDDLAQIEKVKTRLHSDYRGPSGKEKMMALEEKDGPSANVYEQIEAGSLMDHFIVPHKPEDAVVVLGVTDHDIYSPKYNFLYGSSRLNDGVGLVSVHRLKGEGPFMENNIRKVISKQIANQFSIKNVKDYNCLMNFHNDYHELSRGRVFLSPIVLQKLKLNIGFDYKERFESLKQFWAIKNDKDMMEYYTTCIMALQESSSNENKE